jgi:hypothetical protein
LPSLPAGGREGNQGWLEQHWFKTMSQLTFSSIPGFFDLADSAIVGGQPLTDDAISKISHNAKFAAVRTETFYLGFFQNGDVLPTPVSPVDGYVYSRAESLYFLILASTRQPAPGFVSGQKIFPTLASADVGSGNLVAAPYQLFFQGSTAPSPGQITIQMYFSASGAASQGLVAAYCLASRSSTAG